MDRGIKPFAGGHCCPPAKAIIDPPQFIINDFFHPQEVPIIHQVEIINQHHCVPVPKHFVTFKSKDVFCSSYRRRSRKRK